MPNFTLSARAISKGEFVPEPGKPRYLFIPEGKPISTDDQYRMNALEWLECVQDAADGQSDKRISASGDVLVFVHGYNNSLEEIRKRHEILRLTSPQRAGKALWCPLTGRPASRR